ncbi:hypothetical protein KFE25_010795 [Diacronema lutheri]|uniref:Uncharacterized protein n=1 Tax=Diacronema lutheri TaxID=2081491 RepID=A0A8J5XDJ1_DIALT|nr:hypothetical protein KFE25_010795 [Diacronema lutheri]
MDGASACASALDGRAAVVLVSVLALATACTCCALVLLCRRVRPALVPRVGALPRRADARARAARADAPDGGGSCANVGDEGDGLRRSLAFLRSPLGRADGAAWSLVSSSAVPGSALRLRLYQGSAREGDLLGARGVARGEGALFHAIRCTAPFPAPVHVVVASVRELDLMPSWNPYTLHAQVLRSSCPTHVTAGCLLWTPRPFPRARLLVDARLHDALDEHGCVVIAARPPARAEADADAEAEAEAEALLPPAVRAALPLPVHVIATATPLAPPACATGGSDGWAGASVSCECELITFLPAALVPGWVLRFALWVGFPAVYRAAAAMLGAAALVGSPLAARVRDGAQRELYAALARGCAARLARSAHGVAHGLARAPCGAAPSARLGGAAKPCSAAAGSPAACEAAVGAAARAASFGAGLAGCPAANGVVRPRGDAADAAARRAMRAAARAPCAPRAAALSDEPPPLVVAVASGSARRRQLQLFGGGY